MKIWQRIKAAIHKATAPEPRQVNVPVVYCNGITINDPRAAEELQRLFDEALETTSQSSGPEHT